MCSDKVYVTAISNPTLPLIRFELTDQVTFLDRSCPCGSAHQLIADVEGRLDDAFRYPGGQVVHPHVFRSALGRAVAAELARLGLPEPTVEVRVVDQLVRQATGKVRRFQPLEAVVSRPA